MAGRIRWAVLDRHGRQMGPEVEHPNLITDQGLDNIATGSPYSLRQYMHVGDGSTTPANGDTSLASEIATTTADGGNNDAESGSIDAGTDEYVATFERTRVYTASGSQNVSEIGFSATGGAGDLNMRALLRDGNGDPTTVSLLDGRKLRVTHTLEVRLSRLWQADTVQVEEYDTGGSLVTTHGGADGRVGALASSSTWVVDLVEYVWWPGRTPSSSGAEAIWRVTSDPAVAAGSIVSAVSLSTYYADFDIISHDSYTPGSHERTMWLTLPESEMNATFWGWQFSLRDSSGFRENECALIAVLPSSFAKANTQTLKLGMTSSWARA